MLENGSITDSSFPQISKKFKDEVTAHFQYFWNRLSEDEQNVLYTFKTQEISKAMIRNQGIIQALKKKGLLMEGQDVVQVSSSAFFEFITSVKSINTVAPGVGQKTQTNLIDEDQTTKATPSKIPKKIQVDWGNNYYINEETPNVSAKFFNDLTQQGAKGLFITRTPIHKAKEQWEIKNSDIIWLCSRTGKNYIHPALEKISHTIMEFVKQNKNSVILLDGVEYIINNNDFLKTLNLLDNLKEISALFNSVLIIPISSLIFSDREMALLGKNSNEITDNTTLDFSKLQKT
jgi:hypothetical protein